VPVHGALPSMAQPVNVAPPSAGCPEHSTHTKHMCLVGAVHMFKYPSHNIMVRCCHGHPAQAAPSTLKTHAQHICSLSMKGALFYCRLPLAEPSWPLHVFCYSLDASATNILLPSTSKVAFNAQLVAASAVSSSGYKLCVCCKPLNAQLSFTHTHSVQHPTKWAPAAVYFPSARIQAAFRPDVLVSRSRTRVPLVPWEATAAHKSSKAEDAGRYA
jgi:hypothetical protein